ncbi:hypothetical protein [Mycolicibacterium fortuitum]|uniref:hypothetical protein n=1 Tax=Mycolicibacterium fortuitum TaxID=1766 RepID=UPI001CDCEFA2|nr:hypothetical protein [Mycolicibacterium fortuitum]UBV14973.1 hypothetical protein H8Z57_30545 [Mycolicibacterium fortuitum]
MTSANVSMRIWHNSIIPWTRQLSRAERRGNDALAARIRERIAAHTATSEPDVTVEQAMHELLRTLRAEGTAQLHTSVSPSESTAMLTLLRREAVTVERGRLTLRDDLRDMDADLLCLMHGTYPTLEDLDVDTGVGGVRETVRSLLERGRGS